jgi:uncharacterized membrane protein
VAMVVLSLVGRNESFKIISWLGLLAIVVSHVTTLFVFLFTLVVIYALSKLTKRSNRPLQDLASGRTILIFTILILAWGGFEAYFLFQQIIGIFQEISASILQPASTLAPHVSGVPRPIQITGLKPVWEVIVMTAGLFTFGAITLSRVAMGLVKRQLSSELIFSITGLVVFSVFLAPYLLGFRGSADLYPRGLTYLYFFAAPIVGEFLVKLRGQHWLPRMRSSMISCHLLVVLLLLLMFLPAVYYGVSPGMYDRNSPIVPSDVRLSSEEWQAMANFATIRVNVQYVFGVSKAQDFVGGLAAKTVYSIDLNQASLGSYIRAHPRALFFLRTSIDRISEYSPPVTAVDVQAMYATTNILYSSGDVIIVASS